MDSRELFKQQSGVWPANDPEGYQKWLQTTYQGETFYEGFSGTLDEAQQAYADALASGDQEAIQQATMNLTAAQEQYNATQVPGQTEHAKT